ncbi:hypothetical protein C3747_186g19 [Trypanosoma cruzi]|uniref:Uncharacterized protein n=2 Tax=Trypanosoma cruzi TaxID=5693 RepID=Q4DPP1_TRYCC|nr:hypothetical protein, conserved [Trypanosoma cruzi]EAN94495.1 hypothetical protein, conserved [Trypanosoma cruzi]PWV02852.1 hypothetical protein C3747_186g19 [Trypanosoma cruzi]RNC53930.1 hypothetical protein TcCL_ESM08687 [Trypanosoma cruzi]|eukprot:XP_816346.1 hypothetical protein [Trypanosoma cruzi strain CL Brener]
MPPYSRVINLYERFTVLSAAAIRREVHGLLGTTTCSTPLLELREVCELLLKSGERSRAILVADALPQAQRQSLVTSLGLTDLPHQPIGPHCQEQQTDNAAATAAGPFPAMELSEMSNEKLLRLGFALQRPQSQRRRASLHFTDSNNDDGEEEEEEERAGYNAVMQRQLFLELRRRRRYKDLMQCVMNWKSKGLLPTRRRTGERDSDGIRKASDEESFSQPMGVSGTEKTLTDVVAPFNAEEALRGLIFNTSSSSTLYGSSGGQWEEALRECPEFFIITLQEPTAALQFLRKTSVEMVTRFALCLLQGDITAQLTHAPSTVHNRPEQRVAWETIASLCFALRPHLLHAKKVVKVDLLQAVLRALREEAATIGDNFMARRSANPSIANDARLLAMRSAVESLCASLSHQQKEAQARFIGLPLFIEVAVALRDCGVQVPSALAQCVFLCLGDSQLHQWNEMSSSGSQAPVGRELLVTLLSSPPTDRWVSALRLLRLCDERREFVVTAAHLRCILSGLQSISISHTWQTALCVANSIMNQYDIFPDDASVEKLMLNLHAASWQRAFEVLHLYDKNHIAPPPQLLRDLHVVAMKHSSWDVVLRVMQWIEEVGSEQASFMNHVYCLRAFGCAGKWKEAMELLKRLKGISGLEMSGRSVFNEVTVAVPVMGMVENEHWESVVRFVVTLFRQCGAKLTREGREVALAAELLALLRIGDVARLAFFLNRHSGEPMDAHDVAAGKYADDDPQLEGFGVPSFVEELRAIVQRAMELHSLCGMEHLNAPIRLVYDIIAGEEYRRNHHAERIGPVTRGMPPQRPLYLPPLHVQAQYESFATALGKMIRREERLFSVATQQAVAEAMSKAGAGSAYLKAALL